MDAVLIEALEVEAVIGELEWEREVEQRLLVDLSLEWDNRAPGQSDDLADALDYAAVSDSVRECIRSGRFRLLEAAAESVAQMIGERYGVRKQVVVIRKPGAVTGASSVGVRIERGGSE